MHGNQWVLKIAVLKYYSVSKRGTTAKSNPKQATDPISLHTKFGDNSSNTFPLNERKPCVTPDIGRRTSDIGQRTSDGEKSKNNISTPQGGGHNSKYLMFVLIDQLHATSTTLIPHSNLETVLFDFIVFIDHLQQCSQGVLSSHKPQILNSTTLNNISKKKKKIAA